MSHGGTARHHFILQLSQGGGQMGGDCGVSQVVDSVIREGPQYGILLIPRRPRFGGLSWPWALRSLPPGVDVCRAEGVRLLGASVLGLSRAHAGICLR